MYDSLKTVLKLKNAVPQRWMSLCSTLERALVLWESMENTWFAKKKQVMPIADKKMVYMELYSMMAPLAETIKLCQSASAPTGALGLFKLISLRTKYLNKYKSMRVIDPFLEKKALEAAAKSGKGVDQNAYSKKTRHDDLTSVGQFTRERIGQCIDKRILLGRYGEDAWHAHAGDPCSYGYDVCLFFHPNFASLKHVEVMVLFYGGNTSK